MVGWSCVNVVAIANYITVQNRVLLLLLESRA